MRLVWKAVLVVFLVFVGISTSYGEEYTVKNTPANNLKLWTLLVNGVMDTGQHYRDSNGNDLYSRSATQKGRPFEECTLTYNHTNRTLAMTIAHVRETGVRIIGEDKKVSAYPTLAATSVTYVDVGQDASPDFLVKTDIVIRTDKREPAGTTAVVDIIEPITTEKNFSRKMALMVPWAVWEEIFLTEFGHKLIVPEDAS